jgi:serine/threonine protein kinase
VAFAFDQLSGTKVVLKFFADGAEFATERGVIMKLGTSPYVAKVMDVVAPNTSSGERSLERYGCVVLECGDYTLDKFLQTNRRSIDNLQRLGIVNGVLKAVNHLHTQMGFVHNDIKPQNLVRRVPGSASGGVQNWIRP